MEPIDLSRCRLETDVSRPPDWRYRVRAGIDKLGLLFLTFSMLDLILLQAAGIPTALATGLADFTAASLAELRDTFALAAAVPLPAAGAAPPAATFPALAAQEDDDDDVAGPQGAESADPPGPQPESQQGSLDPPRLIFVGRSAGQLSPARPAELDRAAGKMLTRAKSLDLPVEEILVWRPVRPRHATHQHLRPQGDASGRHAGDPQQPRRKRRASLSTARRAGAVHRSVAGPDARAGGATTLWKQPRTTATTAGISAGG